MPLFYFSSSGITAFKLVSLKALKANLKHPMLLILCMTVILSSSPEIQGDLS